MALARVPIHRVLWRSQLFLGVERNLGIYTTAVAIGLPFNGMNLPSLVVGVLLWTLAMPALRWLAKMDPQFSTVYRRHLNYRRHYPPRSRPYRTV